MSIILFDAVLLIIVFVLLIILSWIWPPDSPWAPWWKTNKETARRMCQLANVTKKDIIYDLGCGDGTALIIAAKEFGANGVGVEIDPLRVIIATLMTHILGLNDKLIIKRKNFFDEKLSLATVVFIYLIPKTINRLLPKLKKELKPGTKIVSYRYKIQLPLIKEDQNSRIYIYKIA